MIDLKIFCKKLKILLKTNYIILGSRQVKATGFDPVMRRFESYRPKNIWLANIWLANNFR